MSFPGQGSLPQRRRSTTQASTTNDDDSGLTQSLSQLSLTKEPTPAKSQPNRRSSTASNTPLKLSTQRSPSTTPRPRQPSRSPSNGPDSRRGSRAGTPPLLRKASMNSLHSANGAGTGNPLSRRRSSGQLMSPTSRPPPEEEKPPVTASSIASDYFRAELEAHHASAAVLPSDTIVILNDAVYGHRFSRPRTSRNALSTIVERPERIKASILGVSAAYVRLGGRHCQGRLPIDPKRSILDVDSIPFRIHKTTRRLPLSSPAVTNVHGTKWMEELRLMCNSAESTLAMGGKELQRRGICRGPDDPVPQQLHEGDLYLCAESLAAMEGALGAVCEAVDTVFSYGGPRKAFVGVRPPGHHCSASHPSGFCWVNNVHVGIMHGVLSHGLTHAAIIDFDLHHGDGSQAITWHHNSRATTAKKTEAAWKKTSIGYFSLHDINSYPCEWGDPDKVKNASICIDNAHGQSIWNVHLQSWKTEHDFWKLYETTYSVLLEKTRTYLKNQSQRLREANQTPKAAIFFSAGFDASEWESAGMQRHQVNVPTEFYARLTQDVVRLASEEGLDVDGRVISVLEGGYSDRALFSGILSHLSGMVGNEQLAKTEQESNGLAYEMGQKIGAVSMDTDPAMDLKDSSTTSHAYNPSWWATGQLDQLEQPVEPPSPPRKPRNTTPPTYSSPTQASTARVTDPVRMRRSLSSLSTSQPKVVQRPPSPPAPDVSWVVAAKELCSILIPSDRQTDSHKAEELNAEASRARKDRQSLLLGLPPPAPTTSDRPPSRKSLRERKSRAIGSIDEETTETLQKTRRKPNSTPLTSPIKATRGTPQPIGTQSARRSSRRLSGASHNLSPPREEPPPVPPVPATAPAPRRTTTSRPTSQAGRVQSSGKVPVQKMGAASARKDTAPNPPRTVGKASTPARTDKQPLVGADTPTPSTGLPIHIAGNDMKADMDNLTTGVKKIRINLITQSQKEARKKAASEASCASEGSEADHDSTVIKSEKPPTPVGISSIQKPPEESSAQLAPGHSLQRAPPTPSLSGGVSTPVEDLYPSSTSSPTPVVPFHTGSSPDVPHVAIQPASDAGDFFIPYQPEGPEPIAVMQHEPLKWLPPNVPTPTASTPVITPNPAKKQSGLFEYKSGIPFAPRPDKATQNASGSGGSHLPGNENKPELRPTAHSLWQAPSAPPRD
ncbi:histone deacetylase [Conoideocrella luteorostrata]|uniref:Histone deacetylase n=1 Tax=Conoideocrella luteorostrata TaxID=1105319 RepID=A0AAJ0G2X5_9HYPO|nr:histone deacetylase [Conoideocrella luteorostrata]